MLQHSHVSDLQHICAAADRCLHPMEACQTSNPGSAAPAVSKVARSVLTRVQDLREPGPQHFTLMDGELVVDTDMMTDQKTYRFLAYDLVLENGTNLTTQPFSVRPGCAS